MRYPADGFRGHGFSREDRVLLLGIGHAGKALCVRQYGAGPGSLAQYLLRKRGAAVDSNVCDEPAHSHSGEILPYGLCWFYAAELWYEYPGLSLAWAELSGFSAGQTVFYLYFPGADHVL